MKVEIMKRRTTKTEREREREMTDRLEELKKIKKNEEKKENKKEQNKTINLANRSPSLSPLSLPLSLTYFHSFSPLLLYQKLLPSITHKSFYIKGNTHSFSFHPSLLLQLPPNHRVNQTPRPQHLLVLGNLGPWTPMLAGHGGAMPPRDRLLGRKGACLLRWSQCDQLLLGDIREKREREREDREEKNSQR